jgi:hypothetical protein
VAAIEYPYESYSDYIAAQADYASRRKTRTRKHERCRQWIYDYLKDHNIEGDSFLCVGARDDSEIDFFTNKGHEATGIDLYESKSIIKCDMSRIYDHPELQYKKFDIVFSMNSLEHCLDLRGFVRGLNLVCRKYFVCMFDIVELTWWDCQRPDFVKYIGTEKYNNEIVKTFPGFEIVVSELHKDKKRVFFILKKLENIYIKSEGRSIIMNYLPRDAVCAELGVYKGNFARMIIRYLSPKKLYLIDPYWKKYGDVFWNGKSTIDSYMEAVKRVRMYDTNNAAVMVVDYDWDFLEDLPDKFFDWIYLDSSHDYQDTLRELEVMARKTKDNGMLAGHDWIENPNNKHHGVYKALKEWLTQNPYYVYYRDEKTQWILKRITE